MAKQARVMALGSMLALVATVAYTQSTKEPPTVAQAIEKACQAAGGWDNFKQLGILELTVKHEEVTQGGDTPSSEERFFFTAPGPLPGRFEMIEAKVVAADDGSGGWAVTGGQVDARPGTQYMIKRILNRSLFPILLPFSLKWGDAEVTSIQERQVNGQPVWRLILHFGPNFFDTPQISTTWAVDLDKTTFAVVKAESQYTDLGKGIEADGMRFTWRQPVKVGRVLLPGEQKIVGLDQKGQEKTHTRLDRITYRQLASSEARVLFPNPVPASQRPKPPQPVAPTAGGTPTS
jgi:hypothetical protein